MSPLELGPRHALLEEQLEVFLRVGYETERCRVGELGRRGLFLLTSSSYPLQQLVHLSIILPSGEALSVLGMVEDVIEPEEALAIDTDPGVSVRFYGLGRAARQRWEAYLSEAGLVGATPPPVSDSAAPADEDEGEPSFEHSWSSELPESNLSQGSAPSWAREPSLLLRARGGPQRLATLHTERPRVRVPDALVGHVVYRLVLPTPEAVVRFGREALSSGGVFIATQDLRPTGTPAIVCVVHPVTRAEFHLPGEIRPSAGRQRSGVSVAFTAISPRTMAAFMRFADRELASALPSAAESSAPYAELSLSELSREVSLSELAEALEENTEEVEVRDLDALQLTPKPPERG